MANVDISPFTLGGEPAGLGTMGMGYLDHAGYSMSDENDFYTKFIVELVPNNANDAKYYVKDLKPVKPAQPRFHTRTFNATARWAINAPDAMNIMYSQDPLGKGKVSRMEGVWVDSNNTAYEEARAMAFEDQVRPRLIHFPLPASPERFLWIDLSWPIRNILLPISQVSYPGEKPNCTYAQIEFRHLYGRLSTSGSAEDNNQGFYDWVGDDKRGLVWGHSPATMRVDMDLLYKLLTLPRHMRRDDFNVLAALQLQRWDAVPYNPRLNMNSGEFSESGIYVSNYELIAGSRSRKSSEGVPFDQLMSDMGGVDLQYPPPPESVMVNILNTVVSFGLSLVPVIGPLLAISSNLVFKVLEDPDSLEVKNLLTAEFGVDLAIAIIESALGYRDLKKPGTRAADAPPPGTMPKPLYFGESADDYKLNPNIKDPTEAEKIDEVLSRTKGRHCVCMKHCISNQLSMLGLCGVCSLLLSISDTDCT